MKKVFWILVVLLFATDIWASQSIQVEWGYTPPTVPAVTGYQLYQNGNPRIIWSGADTRQGDVTLENLVIGDAFTLTARFADDTESPHSATFIWQGGKIFFVNLHSSNASGYMTKPGSVRLR
jgi:hypothetical protein